MRFIISLILGLLLGTGAFAQNGGADPRAGDPQFERSQALFGALRDVLEEASEARARAREAGGVVDSLAGSLGLDAQSSVERVLAEAFAIASDADVSQILDQIKAARNEIGNLNRARARLREDLISAPDDVGWKGYVGLAKDRQRIETSIAETDRRIAAQEARIEAAKSGFRDAMAAAGAPLSPDEADLLLESVAGADLVRLAAAYQAVRGISERMGELMAQSGEELTLARRYYAMHTALIAMLAHAQTEFVNQIDDAYLPRLAAVERDIQAARAETKRLLQSGPLASHRQALEGNLAAQALALEAAEFYRRHLKDQRAEIALALAQTVRELEVADNTLRTVDASFQLRRIMENATLSFEALQNMKSPGIERIFRNEQLRREFQALSGKLAPTS